MNCSGIKKIFTLCFYLSVTAHAFTQTLSEIRQLAAKNQLADARDAIETFLSKNENTTNAEAWYLKGHIYKDIANNDSLHIPLTEPRVMAFEAFKKCMELEPKNKLLQAEKYLSFFSLYNSFFGRASQCYTSAQYSCAFDYFVHAEKVQQYIFKKGFTWRGFKFTATDTNLLVNTAICAFKAGKKTEGIVYYTKLADARIRDPEYLPVYHALVDYFISVKDEIAFRKYLSIGRQMFPYDQYWVEAELSMIKSKGLNAALIRSFEEKLRKNPGDFNLNYTFCTELFNMLFSSETNPEEAAIIQKKLEERMEKTIPLQQSGVSIELLQARYYFNNARNLRGAANELPEQTGKEKLQEEYTAQFEKARTNALTVYQYFENKPNLKRSEIESFKIAANILAGVADILNRTEEANTYRTKITEITKMIPVRQ